MADKPEKKSEAPAAPPAEKGAKDAHASGGGGGGGKGGGAAGLLTKLPVLLGGVMLIEAVVLFAGFKFLAGGTPKAAVGADLVEGAKSADGKEGSGATTQPSDHPVEVQLIEFKALNKLSGHSFLYDVSIFVTVKPDFQSRVEDAIKAHQALIEDRVRTIIAELDPEKLGGGSEPGLETMRRQVKYQLDEILGEGLVDEVLVPRCIPFRTDY
jgi:flagellar basal body-associated protein FliL